MDFPGVSIADHDVENGDQFSHSSDQRHEFGFAICHQTFIKAFDGGVMFHRDNSGHIQSFADLDATAAGGAFAAQVGPAKNWPGRAATRSLSLSILLQCGFPVTNSVHWQERWSLGASTIRRNMFIL